MIQLRVLVSLKTSVFDPQGRTTLEALHGLGYKAAIDLRQGKSFLLSFDGISEEEAERQAGEMAAKVLSNPVIESFKIERVA
ncbi:MAG: phosphoribosylformylglycinamidine synthase subunit PurS [Vicinamibacteria bacterium]|nr:phosphoribosylformylglycinamidine synthase subunit PurS [Vicinamibacteria bacterium]